jgi:antitoxin ChpS
VESGRLVVEPEAGKRYALQELLAQCDRTAPLPGEDAQWTVAASKGQELI